MIIHIASDHAALSLKLEIIRFLKDKGIEVVDHGPEASCSVDYPDYAEKLCRELLNDNSCRGILLCGSGLGMSIAANRYRGIRAALCHDVTLARLSREHNDSNVLVLGGRMTGTDLALEIVNVWLETKFSEIDRHSRRIQKLDKIK
ncbi:MAG: ribose 5-phosphate isomerase B [Candidatus Coatesbacteria bacterium]|nr:ribose 5-phosphate isomerase B [Candidatus Coatesbacteria bacterium]